jgi:amino acid adenylation domain-containing protein
MNATNISAIYSLSPLQQGMLFRTISEPESSSYVAQFVCKLRGELDVSVLRQAWQQVINRHDILRTAFVWKDVDEPLQVVGTRVNLPWEEHDWCELSSNSQQQRLEEYLRAERRRGFDPTHAPLMRLSLIRMSEDESAFVWTYHHLLMDGWSTALLMREVANFYQVLLRGEPAPSYRARPYGEYIDWLRRQDISGAELFWRKALEGVSVPTALGVDHNSSHVSGPEKDYSQKEDSLSALQTKVLQTVGRRYRLTLNALLQGAWALLLSRYSGSDDVVFGGVVSGRPAELADVETMVGMFINTLAVRVRVRPDMVLSRWLQELQAEQAEARRYEYSSLIDVRRWAGVPRGQPIFESVLVFANYPIEVDGENQGTRLKVRDVRLHERNDVPLTLEAAPGPELRLRVIYDKARFDDETAGRILGHFKTILAAMGEGLDERVNDVPILTSQEHDELLSQASAPLQCGPDQVLQQLFETCAAANPDGPAISFDGEVISYAELNGKSNQIAHGLLNIAAGKPTAVMLGGGPDHLAVLLGILKAGCPFVCIDPNYPSIRVSQILKDIEPPCIISNDEFLQVHETGPLRQSGMNVFSLNNAQWFETCPVTNPETTTVPQDLAYIAFTSGSTGQPKGIMQTHRSFCQFLEWQKDYFGIGPGKRVAHWASLTYDASYCEIFGALCYGATLCMTTPSKRYDPVALVEWVREERITFLQMVPSFCRQMLEAVNSKHGETGNPCPDLEHLALAGEPLTADLARAWLRRFGGINQLSNLYGPTESVLATYYPVNDIDVLQRNVPIGRAIDGRQLLILDKGGRLCPIGATGEIYIRSPYLTSGYWGRPEETKRSFIQNPLHHDYFDPVYRTGDLGRWLSDGNAEFCGRKDQQIKIRGMRIEVEEIESALRQHDLVGDAAVVAHQYDDMDLRLVAYVVLKLNDTEPNVEERLRRFLKGLLPEQMVPAMFVFPDTLPRTLTGKLDRKSLSKPDIQRQIGQPFVAPRTPLESFIASIWRDLLHVDRIGAEDNFFELGGHSILATQAVNRMREKGIAEISLRTFLEWPTIADLARHIETEQQQAEAGPKVLELIESIKQLSAEETGVLLRSKRDRQVKGMKVP